MGTGALTLPAAFKDAGYLLSSVILILLAFMSFLTATFVIESMAAANALLAWRQVLFGIDVEIDIVSMIGTNATLFKRLKDRRGQEGKGSQARW